MTRIVVHAGFHKTGTTSLQDYLRHNPHRLTDHAAIYLKEDFLAAGNCGRLYGLRPYPWRLWRFRHALRQFLTGIEAVPQIFLSWEGFSGVMPGHQRLLTGTIRDFSRSAIPLARTIASELRHRFGPDCQIEFLYTLRDRESWIRSVWGHLVRSIRLTQDFASFRRGLPDLPRLDAEAARIARALAPVPVHTSWLEDCRNDPLGPAGAALRLLGVPEATLATLPPAPTRNLADPPELSAAYLQLNRSMTDKVALKREKAQLQAEFQRRQT
ncbi:MAG: hypothetical protein PHX82_07270 [Paracoccaceae bacterium]|nr:hypothetical protein [Paracoccaceae bacterium]